MVVLVGVTGGVLGWQEVGQPRRPHQHRATAGSSSPRWPSWSWWPPSAPTTTSGWCPRSPAGKATAALSQLWTTIRLEVLLLAVVVAITSVLVVVTPARTEADGGVVERIVELGDAGSVQLTVAPAQAGFNQIHLYLFDPDGRPAEIAESVDARHEPARRPTSGPITREAVRAGPAHFQLDGDDLARRRRPGPSRSAPASTASPRRPGPPRSRSPP